MFLLALCKMKENITYFPIAFSHKQSFLRKKSEKQLYVRKMLLLSGQGDASEGTDRPGLPRERVAAARPGTGGTLRVRGRVAGRGTIAEKSSDTLVFLWAIGGTGS